MKNINHNLNKWHIANYTRKNKFQRNLNQHKIILNQQIAYENAVYKKFPDLDWAQNNVLLKKKSWPHLLFAHYVGWRAGDIHDLRVTWVDN